VAKCPDVLQKKSSPTGAADISYYSKHYFFRDGNTGLVPMQTFKAAQVCTED